MAGSRLLGIVLAAFGAAAGQAKESAACSKAFGDFVAKFSRVYATPEEAQARLAIFCSNLAFIEAHNALGLSFTLGVNELADQRPEDVAAHRLGLSGPASAKPWGRLPLLGTHKYSGSPLPQSVDWSQKGAVTPPKNQAQCGSCWSFASTGALEGAWAIATGKLVSLSEQQLVDCSKDNQGCNGGDMDAAWAYLEKRPVCTEASYPYQAKDGVCHEANCTVGIPAGGVIGFKDVPVKSMSALMEAVSQQPVAVAIEADQMAFQLYTSGILTQKCGAKLDHGVLVVGYGTDQGVDYWKVKNSWGPQWGESGYIRIERGVPDDGECGIKDQPSFPVVKPTTAAEPLVV